LKQNTGFIKKFNIFLMIVAVTVSMFPANILALADTENVSDGSVVNVTVDDQTGENHDLTIGLRTLKDSTESGSEDEELGIIEKLSSTEPVLDQDNKPVVYTLNNDETKCSFNVDKAADYRAAVFDSGEDPAGGKDLAESEGVLIYQKVTKNDSDGSTDIAVTIKNDSSAADSSATESSAAESSATDRSATDNSETVSADENTEGTSVAGGENAETADKTSDQNEEKSAAADASEKAPLRGPAANDAVVKLGISWDDENNALAKNGTRPESVTVTLLNADGSEYKDAEGNKVVKTVTADDGWKTEFTGLPSGTYSVSIGDDGIFRYTDSIYHESGDTELENNIVIDRAIKTGSRKIEFSWSDYDNKLGLRPEKVKFTSDTLADVDFPAAEGEFHFKYPLTKDDSTSFKYDLQKPDGYYLNSSSKTTITINNSEDGDLEYNFKLDASNYRTFTGKVTWNDNNDAAKLRPSDNSIVLQKKNSDGVWEEVPKSELLKYNYNRYFNEVEIVAARDGDLNNYRLVQKNVPNYYTQDPEAGDPGKFYNVPFKNTLNTEKLTSFTVNIEWENENGSASSRPSEIGFDLYYTEEGSDEEIHYNDGADDKYVSSTASSCSWDNLPLYSENGKKRTYFVREAAFQAYTAHYSGTTVDGNTQTQTVTNTRSDDWNYLVDLFWLTDNPSEKEDLKTVTVSQNNITIQYQLTVITNSQTYPAESMTITIPYYLWNNRYGNPIKPELHLPDHEPTDAEKASLQYPFYYTVDDNGTPSDKSDDKMVLKNWKQIDKAYKIEIPVSFNILPYASYDMSQADFQATAEAQSSTQATPETQTTREIKYTLDTGVKLNSVHKSVNCTGNNTEDFRTLQSRYGDEIDEGKVDALDTEHYNYVEYKCDYKTNSYNQPFHYAFTETPGQGGEVVAVINGTYLLKGSQDLQDTRTENQDHTYTYTFTTSSSSRYSAYVLVRYPKESESAGDTPYYTNDINVSAVADDPNDAEKFPDDKNDISTLSDDAGYMWIDYDWLPQGDLVAYYKELDYKSFQDQYGVSRMMNGDDAELTGFASMTVKGTNLDYSADDPRYEYSMEITDSDLYWHSNNDSTYRRMTSDDYSFTDASLSDYQFEQYDIDKNSGQSYLPSYELNEMPFILQYQKAGENTWSDWKKYYLKENASGSSYTVTDGEIINAPESSDTIAKVRVLSPRGLKGNTKFRMNIKLKLKSDSPQFQEWSSNTETPLTNIGVRNYGTYRFLKNDGNGNYNWYDSLAAVEGEDSGRSDWKTRSDVETNYDIPEYGHPAQHYFSDATTGDVEYGDEMTKTTAAKSDTAGNTFYTYSDPNNNKYVTSFTLSATERVSKTDNKSIDDGILLNSGTFYDLLPEGYTYRKESAKAYDVLSSYYLEHKINDPGVSVQVNTIDNYKDTGRQMVIFEVTRSKDEENIKDATLHISDYVSKSVRESVLKVCFQADLTYQEYLFHPNGTNLAAFYAGTSQDDNARALKGNDSSSMASKDDGTFDSGSDFYGVNDKNGVSVFKDLNGNDDTATNEAMYASSPVAPEIALPTQSGLTKEVKGKSGVYSSFDEVNAGGDYSYRVTYYTGNNGDHGRVVLYDILEDAVNIDTTGEEGWKGVFDSVEMYKIPSEIEPVVYYSTATNLDYNTMHDNEDNEDVSQRQDISNSDIWTTEMPSDKSKITAVAVDLSTAADGTSYVFKEKEFASFIIHMKAPDTVPEPLYAYNRSAYNSAIKAENAEEGFTNETIVIGSRVKIRMRIDIPVEKVWKDNDNEDKLRPDSVKFELYANGEDTGKSVTLDGKIDEVETEAWKAAFTDLPQADDSGNKITYTIKETDLSDYYTSSDEGTQAAGLKIINTVKPITWSGSMPLTAEKTLDGEKPGNAKFTFELYDGTKEEGEQPLQSVTNDTDGNVAFTPIEFKKDDIGKEHTYTVVEKASGSKAYTYDSTVYTVKVTPQKGTIAKNTDGSLKGTITAEPAITSSAGSGNVTDMTFANTTKNQSVTAKKVWDDNQDGDYVRPDALKLTLKANGEIYEADGVTNPVTLTKDDADPSDTTGSTWTYTWNNLPMADDGQDIKYTVEEEVVPHYTLIPSTTSSEDGTSETVTLTNKLNTILYTGGKLTLEAEKTLDGGKPGNAAFSFTLTGDASNPDGKDEVSQTKSCTSDGKVYFDEISFTKADVGKTFKFEVKEVAGTGNYKYDKSVYEVTVTPSFGDFTEGETRSIVIDPVYTLKTDASGNAADEEVNDIAFANETEEQSVTAKKVWDDNNDADSVRPDKLVLTLYANGSKYEADGVTNPVTLTKDDADPSDTTGSTWTYTWNNLPMADDGQDIKYTVEEEVVPHYTLTPSTTTSEDGTSETVTLKNELNTILYTGGKLRLEAEKTLDGGNPGGAAFSFTLTGDASNPDGKDEVSQTKSCTADGKVYFDEISFTKADVGKTFKFEVKEEAGSGNYEYDKSVYEVTVTPSFGDFTEGETRSIVIDPEYTLKTDASGNAADKEVNDIAFANETGEQSVTARKVWEDNNDADGVRPDKLVLTLYANGSKYEADGVTNPVTLTKDDADPSDSTGSTWTYTWDNLPMKIDGEKVTYTVKEDKIPYYDSDTVKESESGTEGAYSEIVTLTNSHKVFTYEDGRLPLTAQKTLDGGTPGSEVFTFVLTADENNPNGRDKISQTKECKADGTVNFDDIVFTKDDVGKTFVFYVKEKAGTKDYEYDPAVYRVSVTPSLGEPGADGTREVIVRPEITKVNDGTVSSAYSIVFANKTKTTNVTILKKWKNEDDNAVRPNSVKVQLYQTVQGGEPDAYGDVVELTEADNWAYTWSGLPLVKDGKAATYTVREIEGPQGYIMKNSGEAAEAEDSTAGNIKFVLENDWIKTRQAKLELEAEKNVDGTDPSDQQVFDFVLEELMPDGTVNEIDVFKNNGKQISIGDIPEFTYDADDIGNTYHYLLREESGSDTSGMKYDDTVYDIRVTVEGGEVKTDSDGMPYRDVIIQKEISYYENGKKFEQEEPASMLYFNNITIPDDHNDGGSDSSSDSNGGYKTNGGSDSNGSVRTGDTTNILIYLLTGSGAALTAALLVYRRRKKRR
jgi:hypothetical protein